MSKVRINETKSIHEGNVHVEITADELEIEVDPLELGRAPAQAIAESVKRGIQDVRTPVAPATIRRRRADGISSTQKWNATGELARGITVERDGNGYAIVAPSGRLEVDAIAKRIAADVPAIADPITPEVDAAIAKTADSLVTVRRK